MVLTDTAIRNAKPADKPYKVTDSKVCICSSIQEAASCGESNTGSTA